MNNARNKKVIFFLPSLDMGGGERVVSELSQHFSDTISTTIVILENKVTYPYKGTLIPLDIPTPQSFFAKAYYILLGCLRFRRLIKKEHPDAVISLGILPNFINALVNRQGIIRVGNSLSQGYWGLRGRILKLVVPFLFKRVKKVVVISYGLQQDLIKNFGIPVSHITVIHNPIDIEKITELSKEPIEATYQHIFKHPVIINIGRLSEQKGQWHLLQAFHALKKTHPDAKLVILGEGYYEPYIKKVYHSLDLEKDVHFLGWQENPFKFLARSRIFVLSSLWEGLGNVIIEAMACGLPVISFDCPSGPRDILAPKSNPLRQTSTLEQSEFGILTPIGNEDVLTDAMTQLLSDDHLNKYYQTQSRLRAKDFSISHIINQYESLI